MPKSTRDDGSGTALGEKASAVSPGRLAPRLLIAPVVGSIVTIAVAPGAPGFPGPPSFRLMPNRVPDGSNVRALIEPDPNGAPDRVATVVTAPVALTTVRRAPEAPAAARYIVPAPLIASAAPLSVMPASPTLVAAPVS